MDHGFVFINLSSILDHMKKIIIAISTVSFLLTACTGPEQKKETPGTIPSADVPKDTEQSPDEFSGTYSYIHERTGKENFIMVRRTVAGYEIKSGAQPYLPATQEDNRLVVTSDPGTQADHNGSMVVNIPSTLIFSREREQYKAFIAIPDMDTIRIDLKKR